MYRNIKKAQDGRFGTAFVLTLSLFALWGLGQRLYDTLMPQFAAALGLHGLMLALTWQIAGVVYFFGAIPAALCARRFGFRGAIIFGLGSLGIGAFLLYPAAEMRALPSYLFAAAMMAFGWILLEVAANPLAAALGSVETSVRRLNMAQSVFPLGALLGLYLGRWIAVSNLTLPSAEYTYSIVHPYILVGVGVFLLAFVVDTTRFPPVATAQAKGGAAGELRTLFSRPLFLFGLAAQFFCVLALAGTWAQSWPYVTATFPQWVQVVGIDVFVVCLVLFAIGRFVGSVLMYWVEPDRLLAAFCGGGLVLTTIAAVSGGPLGAISLVASGLFLSITWPTVLGISIRGLGPLMKMGTALVCMGGAVGGVVYNLLNVVWKFPSVHFAMIVPAVSYAVVLAFALTSARAHAAAVAAKK